MADSELIESLKRRRPEVAFAVTADTVTATAIQLGVYVDGVARSTEVTDDTVNEALRILDGKLATRPAYEWKCDQ